MCGVEGHVDTDGWSWVTEDVSQLENRFRNTVFCPWSVARKVTFILLIYSWYI